MEFIKTPSFWCPHVGRAACNNFGTRTIELTVGAPRNPPFSFSLFPPLPPYAHTSVSLTFFIFLLYFLLTLFPPFFVFLSFLFLFAFLFFSFSFLSSHFLSTNFFPFLLFFFSLFLFLFVFLFSSSWTCIDRMSKETISSSLPHSTCVVHTFPSFIPYFLFLL